MTPRLCHDEESSLPRVRVPLCRLMTPVFWTPLPPPTPERMQEIRDRLVEIWNAATELTPESAVLITNFAFYYGDNESPSPTGMGAFFPSLSPRMPILAGQGGDPIGDAMMADLIYCIQTYDMVPRQI